MLWKAVLGTAMLAAIGAASFGTVSLASTLTPSDEPGSVQNIAPVVSTGVPAVQATAEPDAAVDPAVDPAAPTQPGAPAPEVAAPVVVPPAGSQDIDDSDVDDYDDVDDDNGGGADDDIDSDDD